MFSSHHIDRDQYRYHICIFISSQLVVIDIGIDIVNIIIIILLHHISRDQYDIFVLFSSSLFYLISIDPSRRRGLSISSFVVILIVLIIITATCSWLLWSSFFSHHTIMIITIFFSSKTHRIDRDHYLLSFHHIVYTVRSWWLLYSFFPSHHTVGDH